MRIGKQNMLQLRQKLRLWLIPPITQRKALKIVAKKYALNVDQIYCYGEKPSNGNIYNAPIEPCWYIHAPWGDGLNCMAIRSSRLIIISKLTGIILYDGSLHDEG